MRLQASPSARVLRRRGFTLVEILATVVIIAIAATMVVPRLGSTGDVQALAAMQETVADIEYAQNQAITTQLLVTVAFNINGDSFTVQDANSGKALVHPTTKRNFVVPFKTTIGTDRVSLLTASFNGQPNLTFDTLGAPLQGGTVSLGAEGFNYKLEIFAVTGKITVTGP